MADLGRVALIVCLGAAVHATFTGAVAARLGRRRLAESAAKALYLSSGAAVFAMALLVYAFINRDFSNVGVANHSNRALPLV